MILDWNTSDNIERKYFMDFYDYCEIQMVGDNNASCYRCGKKLIPLTWIDPDFYYQPCWSCTKSTDRDLLTEGLIRGMKDFYNRMLGDRYLQLFILEESYFSATYPHNFTTFKKIVSSLDPPGRNDVWFLDWIPSFPKMITMDNIEGLRIITRNDIYNPVENTKTCIKLDNGYELRMPECTGFDSKHYARYSILNKAGDRRNKRVKLGSKCLRLFNTEDDSVKALFKLYKDDMEIVAGNLSYEDYAMIKLAVMRNKTFMRLVFDVILELSRVVGVVRDSMFLKNTVILDPKKSLEAVFLWSVAEDPRSKDKINISII